MMAGGLSWRKGCGWSAAAAIAAQVRTNRAIRATSRISSWPQQSLGRPQRHAAGHEFLDPIQQAVTPSGHDERLPALPRCERLVHHFIRRLLVAWRPMVFDAGCRMKVGGGPA